VNQCQLYAVSKLIIRVVLLALTSPSRAVITCPLRNKQMTSGGLALSFIPKLTRALYALEQGYLLDNDLEPLSGGTLMEPRQKSKLPSVTGDALAPAARLLGGEFRPTGFPKTENTIARESGCTACSSIGCSPQEIKTVFTTLHYVTQLKRRTMCRCASRFWVLSTHVDAWLLSVAGRQQSGVQGERPTVSLSHCFTVLRLHYMHERQGYVLDTRSNLRCSSR
jgi:hypothetical protein